MMAGDGTLGLELIEDVPELTDVFITDASAFAAAVFLLERAKVLAELAAACTLAAFEDVAERFGPSDHVVLVLCGGNVSVTDLLGYGQRFGGAVE